MGSFLFKWDHPATEVYVSGTFDDWGKTVKLEKKEGNLHQKLVEFPKADEKIFYKFVVDDNWTTDHTAPQETDDSGNTNNVLHPEKITKSASNTAGIMSTVTPTSTTAALAGQVPKETKQVEEEGGSSDLPGAFPETPAFENPSFGVNPIPATAGIGNPVHTKPGDPVPAPSTFTDNTIDSAVRLDKESYEKGPGAPVPETSAKEGEANGSGLFSLPEKAKNLIPESSLPIIGTDSGSGASPTVQSSGPQSTTAALAGNVPLEPRGVPEIVKESQEKADVSPEASANPEAVKEKSAVEQELEKKVPEEPATSDGSVTSKIADLATGAAADATAAVGGAAAYLSSTTEDAKAQLPSSTEEAKAKAPSTEAVTPKIPSAAEVKSQLPVPIQETISKIDGTTGSSGTPIAPTVPDVVQESITEAHQAPEAAANKEAVADKSAAEAEILKTVERETSAGEPAPTATAATSETAPKAMMKSTEEPLSDSKTADKPAESTSNGGLAAPVDGHGRSPSPKRGTESRDLSPMTRPGEESAAKPTVTTGLASASTPKKSEAVPASPASAKTGESTDTKKNKRMSGFFQKMKNKFEHKKDKN